MLRDTHVGFVVHITLESASQILERVDIVKHIVLDLDLSKCGLGSPSLCRFHCFVSQCA